VESGEDLATHCRLFIPEDALTDAMDYSAEEGGRSLTDHSTVILNSEGLLGDYASGKEEYTRSFGGSGPGLVFVPTFLGIQLFIWAHGMTDMDGFVERGIFGEFVVAPPAEARILGTPIPFADDSTHGTDDAS